VGAVGVGCWRQNEGKEAFGGSAAVMVAWRKTAGCGPLGGETMGDWGMGIRSTSGSRRLFWRPGCGTFHGSDGKGGSVLVGMGTLVRGQRETGV
jgi:hypothetical protein